MRKPEVSILRFFPVLGLTILRSVRGDDAPLELNIVNIETVVIPDCAEPDIFGVVLPVGLRATPFFSFPRDPVADVEILVQHRKNKVGGLPVAADVNGRFGSQQREKLREHSATPSDVFLRFTGSQNIAVVVLRQVVRRI